MPKVNKRAAAKTESDEIRFYSTLSTYGCFSNFSRHPVVVDGVQYRTSEHYYQSQKPSDPEEARRIRLAGTPGEAKALASRCKLRSDWHSIKENVMRRALRAKFTQNELPRQRLLETGSARLAEHTRNDRYWADGGDGSGANRLGHLLMELREELRRGAENQKTAE